MDDLVTLAPDVAPKASDLPVCEPGQIVQAEEARPDDSSGILRERHELATHLVAKLCHDFISPAGAIMSGLDLLEDPSAQDMKAEALGLIATSAKKMVTLVHFARIAFGAATTAESFSAKDLRKVLDEVFSTLRAELEFDIDNSVIFSKPASRALMNLGMIIGNALPMGGNARITSTIENNQIFITGSAIGNRVRLKPEVLEGLEGKPLSEGLSGQWIQPHWLHCVVAEAGGTLAIEIAPELVKIVISMPN